MGGGGSYYDRDVTPRSSRTSSGFSTFSNRMMSTRRIDVAVQPKSRRLYCANRSPVVYAFDVTGSVGGLSKIICDKWPMIAGQLAINGYLDDPAISLAAVGDVLSDKAPIQICDFSTIRGLDPWLKKLWLERGGGGNADESYELAAYFYAYLCDLPNAATPAMLFTGDQTFRYDVPAKTIKKYFGGEPLSTNAIQVFKDLLEKFKGNVFYLHRKHRGKTDAAIVRQWESALGAERVVRLPEDLAVGDITLGILALSSGSRTVDEYCDDMRTRKNVDTGAPEPQNESRVKSVREALQNVPVPKKNLPAPATKTRRAPRKEKNPEKMALQKDWKL